MLSVAKRILIFLLGLAVVLAVDFAVGPYPAWLNEFRPTKKIGGQQPVMLGTAVGRSRFDANRKSEMLPSVL